MSDFVNEIIKKLEGILLDIKILQVSNKTNSKFVNLLNEKTQRLEFKIIELEQQLHEKSEENKAQLRYIDGLTKLLTATIYSDEALKLAYKTRFENWCTNGLSSDYPDVVEKLKELENLLQPRTDLREPPNLRLIPGGKSPPSEAGADSFPSESRPESDDEA